ncbi:MAG: N-acetylmuramoyl-L-alanine amidase CwlB [Candidatus Gottesmanbacteria bacterium GW2011_GWA2_44_17]|uniref:N-acetylmuramoyl-L-alanine amidase CwlB n=3 Tax=Candidatus Gottesmaniibacteriota TaxID=1752720 RepID=A0A0G1LKV9_9BACT|nr:MAG: N-acetylmuramoyl-L-alanine amidase CwlB [Microgenomates group bacterium GW2011_GWC1_43_11]KKT38722.1 MAG: N-acetylmuramoyl-L-alanine amidase CwlB [Candidatus Gottesmanbacteria bacterium GW2011_GWB1_44_11c]KKT47042.1 MAG: N-acetylmuramoyl-L-alanine amidase CwlB [Candidatus Gottesmanbacteria bacterium GW2011_GWA2_44_17]KKT60564.1 MAG: N-acetylmuramoyl-L-alanine amidase CwlB [Candidatus Gottesmanbacteria bacterium GW2011_GWA1_44_24b]
MKNILVISFSVLVTLFIIAGITGFSYFNKRLTESKNWKESAETLTESGKNILSLPPLETKQNMGAVETSLFVQVISPSDGSTVTSPYITLRGKTVAQAEVFANDKETVADAQGNFSVGLTLEEGENPIMVVANDVSGNVGETEITIMYETSE